MKDKKLEEILSSIDAEYQGTPFQIFWGKNSTGYWVQVGTERPCSYTGEIGIGKGGKAYISNHATDDEIVKKVFGLCIAYVEHETREGFKYKGVRIFNPHTSLEALLIAGKKVKYRK